MCNTASLFWTFSPFCYAHVRKIPGSLWFLYSKQRKVGHGLGTRVHLAENLIASWSDHLLLVRGHWLVYWWEVTACTHYIKWHKKAPSGRLRYYNDVLENLVLLVFLMQPTHVLSWTDLKLCMTHINILSSLVSMSRLAFSRLQYKLNRDWEWGYIIP